MNTSLASDPGAPDLKMRVERLLGTTVTLLDPVEGGRNGRVYRAATPSEIYAVKTYFRHASDSRPRLRTEFDSLTFLTRNGERQIAQPVVASEGDDLAVYGWVEGWKISAVTTESIREAADFLIRLAALAQRSDAKLLPLASEACLSGRGLMEVIRRRLVPLLQQPELDAFLRGNLLPALDAFGEAAKLRLEESFVRDLPATAQTLSPSDFGFHNALQTRDGIVFLDFEYFGWDDPAKAICDFLLHPGFSTTSLLRREFAAAMLHRFPESRDRVEAFYPLFGIKWCTILLNEFLPDQLRRRRFAGLEEEACAGRRSEQLRKAEAMLQLVREQDGQFPYAD